MTVIPFPRRPELAEQRSDERTEQLIDRALWEPRDRHPQLAEAQDERDTTRHTRGQVPAGFAQHHHASTGHVLAGVVADPFDNG